VKVTMIVGMPGVGKSTVMKRFMARVGEWKFESPKWVPHHVHTCEGDIVGVLGRYDDLTHEFPGTDRMSMACQPHVVDFILKARNLGWRSIFFEGDRLGNDKMIKSMQYIVNDFLVMHIKSTRNFERASQTDTFRQSRATKLRNMFASHGRLSRAAGPAPKVVFNNGVNDLDEIANWLIENRL